MILTYNEGEFVVNNVEIRKIICEPYYEYDYSLYPTCDISEMEAYINGVLIKKACERILNEEYPSYILNKEEKTNKSEVLKKLSKLFPNVCN